MFFVHRKIQFSDFSRNVFLDLLQPTELRVKIRATHLITWLLMVLYPTLLKGQFSITSAPTSTNGVISVCSPDSVYLNITYPDAVILLTSPNGNYTIDSTSPPNFVIGYSGAYSGLDSLWVYADSSGTLWIPRRFSKYSNQHLPLYSFSDSVCSGDANVVLDGGMPAEGTYSGPGYQWRLDPSSAGAGIRFGIPLPVPVWIRYRIRSPLPKVPIPLLPPMEP